MTEDPGLRLVDFLDHIAEASRLALEYVAGMDQQAFLGDQRGLVASRCPTGFWLPRRASGQKAPPSAKALNAALLHRRETLCSAAAPQR